MTNKPTWLKGMKWTAIVILILSVILTALILLPCLVDGVGIGTCDGVEPAILILAILLPIVLISLGFWLIGELINYLNKKSQKGGSNLIIGILLAISVIVFIISFVISLESIRYFNAISPGILWQLGLNFIVIVFFIFLLYITNKKK